MLYVLVFGGGWLWYAIVAYLAFMFTLQRFHTTGGFPSAFMRGLALWRWFRDYFPVRLHRTVELDAKKNYIFGSHPHGVLGFGSFIPFATDACGFAELFPGVTMHLLTLTTNFYIPFYNLYLAALGVGDASKQSCLNILRSGPGQSIGLVLGGAAEALDAHPGTYDLTLKRRKGFVKMALRTGASLVPVFVFGENDLYEQVSNPRGSTVRRWQERLRKVLGFSAPLVKGRGVFQYNIGFLPFRRAVHTVVGAPIDVPLVPEDEITTELIDKYHTAYVTALKALFDRYKDVYAKHRRGSFRLTE